MILVEVCIRCRRPEDKHQDDGRFDGLNCDMPHLLCARCARRYSVIHILADARDSGDEDNRVPAKLLPDIRAQCNAPEVLAFGEEADRFFNDADPHEELIDSAAVGGHEVKHQRCTYKPKR